MRFHLGLNPQRPWRNGLIVTTGLSLSLFAATELWNVGAAEWAFVLAFIAVWLLLSLLWSNDDYIEESNVVLADIVDQNFEAMHERLQKLENEMGQQSVQTSQHFKTTA